MLNIFSVEQAKQSILKRQPPDEFPVSQSVLDGIAKLFGEALTPEQAVTRILTDVRKRGDAALQEWSQRLDNRSSETFRVPARQTCQRVEIHYARSSSPRSNSLLKECADSTTTSRSTRG